MAHTPGPWKVDPKSQEETRSKIVGPEGWLGVAQAFGDDLEETQANAALIASAPDLLAACEAALQDINWMVNNEKYLTFPVLNELGDRLNAAIAAATGQTCNE